MGAIASMIHLGKQIQQGRTFSVVLSGVSFAIPFLLCEQVSLDRLRELSDHLVKL